MGNKLFKDTSSKNWEANASVGGSFTSGYTYAIGYYEAAQKLIGDALGETNHLKDALFYPICFNFRHFVEITLKELIIVTNDLYIKSEKLGFNKKELKKDLMKDLNYEHSIKNLLNRLEAGLECLTDQKIDKEIVDIIDELHHLDPNGQTFRYPRKTNQQLSFKDQQYYDLEFLSKQMEKIEGLLMGIDGWLDHHDSLANDMISSMSPY